jgi:hypothetical protein
MNLYLNLESKRFQRAEKNQSQPAPLEFKFGDLARPITVNITAGETLADEMYFVVSYKNDFGNTLALATLTRGLSSDTAFYGELNTYTAELAPYFADQLLKQIEADVEVRIDDLGSFFHPALIQNTNSVLPGNPAPIPVNPTDIPAVLFVPQNLDSGEQAQARANIHAPSVTDLTMGLSLKAENVHSHPTNQITGLADELNGKAALVHTHSIGQITNLTEGLANKSNVGHGHAWNEITDTPTSFAPEAHSHVSSEITDATSEPTEDTLVLRDDSGSAKFYNIDVVNISFNGANGLYPINAVHLWGLPDQAGTLALEGHSHVINDVSELSVTIDDIYNELEGRAPLITDVISVTADEYTLSGADYGKYIRFTNTTGTELIINPGGWIEHSLFYFRRADGAGPLTLTTGSGVLVEGAEGVEDVEENGNFALRNIFSTIGDHRFDFI